MLKVDDYGDVYEDNNSDSEAFLALLEAAENKDKYKNKENKNKDKIEL